MSREPPGQGGRRSRSPRPARVPPVWAGAPRPSRRTGTPGPLRGSGGRVPAPPDIQRCQCSPVPLLTDHRCREGTEPPRLPQQLLQLSPLPRSGPRRALLRSLTGSAAAACRAPLLRAAAGTALRGTARHGAVRPVGRGAVRCGTVRYGATGLCPPVLAALIPVLPCHSAPLTAPIANRKPLPGAAPRPVAAGHAERGAAGPTPTLGCMSPGAGGRACPGVAPCASPCPCVHIPVQHCAQPCAQHCAGPGAQCAHPHVSV